MFWFPKHLLQRRDERVMCMILASNRVLFGECYQRLFPEYFWDMPKGSGVFIRGLIPTGEISSGATRPGDIDLLIIPYEGDELVLSRTLAVEVKVVRASYRKQGRSPNEYGFTQASHLLALGFPYVAVIHLIVSDKSPTTSWRKTMVTQIIDPDSGLCEELREFYADMMPGDLISRAYGRLKSSRSDERVGVVAAYMGGPGLWYPEGCKALINPSVSRELLQGVEKYFARNVESFQDTPRYSPVHAFG